MLSKYKPLMLVVLLIIVIITGWYFTRSYPPQSKLSSVEEIHVKALLKEMKTHCVGRYLVDLPTSFTLSTGAEPLDKNQWIANVKWPERSYNTYITSKRMYYPAFEQMLKRREKELSKTRTDNPANMPFLKKIWPLPAGMNGVIFERNLGISADDAIRTLEAYIYSEGVAMKIQKESINDLAPRYKKDRERRGSETNYIPGDLDKLSNLLSRLRGREEDEIPRGAGSCIANAFIAAQTSWREEEDIAFVFSSENLLGINFVIDTDNSTREEISLLDRADEITKILSEVDAKIIRKGRREINNMKAEEMLASGPKWGSVNPVYIFNLFINETQGSNKTPYFNAILTNEGNSDIPFTGYNQDELMAMWDTITQTVRMRPGTL
ncbi:T6SS immunity protein Tli4 family protein [Erwinia typographi]|uniref:T6SS immunity protein Tli4 family protein n=1 Tax=Erwinia typographi TaxID=371042 RepID=UPI00068D9BAC|nr:T6SS immunity protein Tli4 family protein [Erwinia typographi]